MIYGGHFEPDKKIQKIKELESQMDETNFWQDKRRSEKVINDLNYLKKQLNEVEECKKNVENDIETINLLKNEFDLELVKILQEQIEVLDKRIENLEISLLLSGKYDSFDAIVEIHSGAGGTEACDWAMMLKRMYVRWCDTKGYKIELIDEQRGDEVGIKSSTIIVHGINSYGYLKGEKGVHRLVRISPFDSGGRRHTSFASLEVLPEITDDIQIEINPDDLRVDTYRASGAGGQHINKTSSAVRITHIPTNIVVACQSERSQIQNRETAMKMLKSKLFNLKEKEQKDTIEELKGEQKDIAWGSQIRSYVFCPYTLVKDHRTNYEVGNVEGVMDGNIDDFIEAYLKMNII